MTLRWTWIGPWVWRFYRHVPWDAGECCGIVIHAGPLSIWTKPHREQYSCEQAWD